MDYLYVVMYVYGKIIVAYSEDLGIILADRLDIFRMPAQSDLFQN